MVPNLNFQVKFSTLDIFPGTATPASAFGLSPACLAQDVADANVRMSWMRWCGGQLVNIGTVFFVGLVFTYVM